MASLDDELAAEEQRELDLHLAECASCRAHVEGERAEREVIHRALAAPPAPELLRARLGRALDAEDVAATRAERQRWTRWLLPGSSIVAAAAAIAVFVAVRPPHGDVGTVANEAVRQQIRELPLEVQGSRTGPWLRANFSPNIDPPQVAEPGTRLIGARLLPRGIHGHDGALLSYQLDYAGYPVVLSVLMVRGLRSDEMSDGDTVKVNGRTLHVIDSDGHVMVSVVDANHMGYMFMAPALSADELIWLVGRTSLVGPTP